MATPNLDQLIALALERRVMTRADVAEAERLAATLESAPEYWAIANGAAQAIRAQHDYHVRTGSLCSGCGQFGRPGARLLNATIGRVHDGCDRH